MLTKQTPTKLNATNGAAIKSYFHLKHHFTFFFTIDGFETKLNSNSINSDVLQPRFKKNIYF